MLHSTLASIDPSYPIGVGVFLLLLILLVLLQISARLANLNTLAQRPTGASKTVDHHEESPSIPDIEVPSGTRFDEFLSEDPSRKSLPKKDQFKAYRKWRAEKGLNWSSKD